MPPSKSAKRVAHSTLVRLLQPHIQDILELVKASLLDENHGDPVYGLAYGIIGDLAEIFGTQIKPLLLQDWVAAELKSRRCPPENKQTMRWAREVGQFQTIRVPLTDFNARLDGQACHRLTIILCRFFPPTSQGLSLLLTILTLLVQRSRSRAFFLPWVRYTFTRALFVDSHPSGGVSSSTPSLHSGSTLLTSRIHFPPSCCYFGLNHPYQSSLYRLNPNPPHHHIVISCNRFLLAKPLQRTAVRSSSVHRPPAYHAVPFRRWSPYWLAVYPGLPWSEFRLFSCSLCHQFFPRILSRYLRFAHRSLLVISSKSRQHRKVSRSLLEGHKL